MAKDIRRYLDEQGRWYILRDDGTTRPEMTKDIGLGLGRLPARPDQMRDLFGLVLDCAPDGEGNYIPAPEHDRRAAVRFRIKCARPGDLLHISLTDGTAQQNATQERAMELARFGYVADVIGYAAGGKLAAEVIAQMARDFTEWANDSQPEIDDPRAGPNDLEAVVLSWVYSVINDDYGTGGHNAEEYPGLTEDNGEEVAEAIADMVDVRGVGQVFSVRHGGK